MVCSKSFHSCPALCDPMDHIPPGSSVHGILQAGILEWVTIPFPKGFSWPSILCRSPALQASSLLSEPRVLTVLASHHAVWERRGETTGRMQALTPCSATKPEGKLWLVRTSDLWNYRRGNLSVWFEKLPSSLQHNFQRPSVPASSQSCCCEHVKWRLHKHFAQHWYFTIQLCYFPVST